MEGGRVSGVIRPSALSALAACLVCLCSPVSAADAPARVDFLISGHSLTDEPLGAMVSEIASSLGSKSEWQRQNIVGSPISARTIGHRENERDPVAHPWTGYTSGRNKEGNAFDLVRELRHPSTSSGSYGFLVIAERHDSLGPLQWEKTVPVLRHFYELAREGSPQLRGYFYTTWADVEGEGSTKANPAGWVRYEREQLKLWESITSRINDSLAREKRADRLATLPASGALAELVDRATTGKVPGVTQGSVKATMDALFSDNVHQTTLGRYYIACVTYSALARRSPKGAWKPEDVSPEAAASLQALAWDYISTYYKDHPNGPQYTFAERAGIARNFSVLFWKYRGESRNAEGSARFFSGTTLENPLWTSADADETSFWLPRLP